MSSISTPVVDPFPSDPAPGDPTPGALTLGDQPVLEEGEIAETALGREMDRLREENACLEKALQSSQNAAQKGRDYLKENIRLLQEAAELQDQLALYADKMKHIDALKKENILLRTELQSMRQDLKSTRKGFDQLTSLRGAAIHSFRTGLSSLQSAFKVLSSEESKVTITSHNQNRRDTNGGNHGPIPTGPSAEKRRLSPPSLDYGASHYSPSKRIKAADMMEAPPGVPTMKKGLPNPNLTPLGPRLDEATSDKHIGTQQPQLNYEYVNRVLTQAGMKQVKEENRRP